MTGVSARLLWGLTVLISVFVLLEPYIPETPVWGVKPRDLWWGLCGAAAGQIVSWLYNSARLIEVGNASDAKKFNEQLKMSSAFVNAIAIGVIVYAIFQRLNSGGSIFHFGTLISLWMCLYFHYIAIKILDLWKPEK